MTVTAFNQIVHRHCNVKKICFYNNIINFCSTVLKRCTIFKCYLCSCIKCLICSNRIITWSCNSSCNGNTSCNQNICVKINLLKNWLGFHVNNHPCFTVYYRPFFVANLGSLLLKSFNKFTIFCVSFCI